MQIIQTLHFSMSNMKLVYVNPFSAGTAFMLMQTGWIQASRRVTRRLAWDPTCLLLGPSFPIKNKQNLKVLKSRRQYNLFLENYPAFKGLMYLMSQSILTWLKLQTNQPMDTVPFIYPSGELTTIVLVVIKLDYAKLMKFFVDVRVCIGMYNPI